jgi:hypothetical protein
MWCSKNCVEDCPKENAGSRRRILRVLSSVVALVSPRKMVVICALAIAACATAIAQEPVLPPVPPSRPDRPPSEVSTPTLYRAFFGHIEHLDREADKRDAQGENSREVREYYQDSFGLSAQQGALLKQHSARTLAAVGAIDQKIQATVQAIRARYPGGLRQPGQARPQAPPELALLDEEKDAVTMQGVAELRAAVGEVDFETIDRFLKEDFARNFTVIKDLPSPLPPTTPLPQSTGDVQ